MSFSHRARRGSISSAFTIFPGLVILLLASAAWPAHAGTTQTLRGHIRPQISGLSPIRRLDTNQHLGLAIELPLRNREILTNLLHEVYDPASTNYRHYLTAQEFAEQFGPTASDYVAVEEFVRSNHLSVVHRHSNRTILDIEGSVGELEQALHVRFQVFQHPREARTFFSADANPTLDLSVPVLAVSGLDNFELPHPANLALTNRNQAQGAFPNGGTAPDGVSFIGSDFRKAYVPGVALTGSGQTVGLFELDGYYPGDITTYESLAGITNNVLVTNVTVGFNGSPGANNVEVALDIEMALAMAPGLSQVLVYEGTQPNSVLNQIATDNQAKQISSSWSWSGYPDSPPLAQIFQQYALQGQTYFNASGDSGAYTSQMQTPTDDTNVTVVGGTTLSTDGNGNYLSERVWSWFPGQADASSGGISTSVPIPVWQQGISMNASQGSTAMRNVPDVALTADNIYVVANNGQRLSGIGGTSAAAPLWAGFLALVNQQSANFGHGPVGYLNPALYALGKSGAYAFDFHDITTGNNTNSSSPGRFFAVAGYDLCTGWGTPNGSNLINALAPQANAPLLLPNGNTLVAEACLPTNGAIDPGETVTVSFSVANLGSAPTTNLVATLLSTGGISQPGGAVNFGAIPANSSASRSFTFTANGSCGGTATASLQLQDGVANLGTINFVLPLGRIVATFPLVQNFDGVSAPALPAGWTSTRSGSDPLWLTSTGTVDSPPNAAFAGESGRSGVSELISPSVAILLPTAQLSFRHNYNTDAGFDGGVLEIQVGSGAFADIIQAGGSFASNGYTQVLGSGSLNPIGGRSAWTGNSGGFVTTTVNLPAAAAGQNIVLKWRFGTDRVVSGAGWYVDSVMITDGIYACCSGSADVAVSQTASGLPAQVNQNLVYAITVTNLGPSAASVVNVTDALPAGVSFVSATAGFSKVGNNVIGSIATLAVGAATNISITVTPTVAGIVTNSINVTTATFDGNTANNSSSLATAINQRPAISMQPSNQAVVAGGDISFSVGASGVPAPDYQWYFSNSIPVGVNSNVLTLTNVQPGQTGLYSVVITNLVGATNSIPASLLVEVPPVIILQPSNQSVLPGATATFSVGATGTPAPGYQWLLNGITPVGANGSLLTLTNVQPGQMGNYVVVVTNTAGLTNSLPAQLFVLASPIITNITTTTNLMLTNSTVTVSFQSYSNLNYTLEYKQMLSDSNWNSIGTTLPGNNGLLILEDTNAAPDRRFYRVRVN